MVVKLMGGLGNQMFQYAFSKALEAHYKKSVYLDLDFLLDRSPSSDKHFVFRDFDMDVFNIKFRFAGKGIEQKYRKQKKIDYILSGFKRKSFYLEESFFYDKNVFEQKDDMYFQGFWQSTKYFKSIEAELKLQFVLKVDESSANLFNEIRGTNSVCINVRRADFVTNPFHGCFGMDYFNKGIEIVGSKIPNPHFFIFSDDVKWCMENFALGYSFTIVTHEHKGRKFGNYLKLMSSCKHFIIPNSSFAWWSVWLSPAINPLVIAPANWFNDKRYNKETFDLVPDNWIRL